MNRLYDHLFRSRFPKQAALAFIISAIPIKLYYGPLSILKRKQLGQTTSFTGQNEECQLSDKLKRLIDEVCEEVDVDCSKFTIATSNHLHSQSTGMLILRNAYLFLPDYLNATSFKQLRAACINQLLRDEFDLNADIDKENWETDEGKCIVQSFLLSDAAKKYLIARDLFPFARSSTIFISYISTVISMFLAMALHGRYLQKIAKTSQKSRFFIGPSNPLARLILFTIPLTSAFGCALYMILCTVRDRDADARALTLGLRDSASLKRVPLHERRLINLRYYLGALELYQKQLERNLALYKLMQKKPAMVSNQWVPRLRQNGGENIIYPWKSSLSTDIRLQNIRRWEKQK